MRTFFPSESCKETHFNVIDPQSWLQVERGKLCKFSSQSQSSTESLIKVPDPPILPFFKPVDYVNVLAKIHEELDYCQPRTKSNLHMLQFQVFKGLGENKLKQRSLRSAWVKSHTVHEKVVYGAWLKYEKRDEEIISDLLSSCGKCAKEFGLINLSTDLPIELNSSQEDGTVKGKVVHN